jgi:hypothetical protein
VTSPPTKDLDVNLFASDLMAALLAGATAGCTFKEREFLRDRLLEIGIHPTKHDIRVLHDALRGAQDTSTITERFMRHKEVVDV